MPDIKPAPARDFLFYQKRKHGKYRAVDAPAVEAPVADTHAHIHMLPDPAFELARCAANNVGFVCAITDPSEDGTQLADGLGAWCADAARTLQDPAFNGEGAAPVPTAHATVPDVRIAVGVHPHNARLYDAAMERTLLDLLADERVCAVGEIGLDYHYDLSPRDDQRRVFRRELEIAKAAGLPVSLHIREAHDEALAILQDVGFPEAGTLLHCCGLSPEELAPWVEAGCYIAYGGPLTFKKADAVRAGALTVPRDRLLTETDSPYMTPEPMRGVMCTPAHVIFTADVLCTVLGCQTPDERRALLEQLMANARALLDRKPTAWQKEN